MNLNSLQIEVNTSSLQFRTVREDAVNEFAKAIAHGDEDHRAWLAVAAVAFCQGKTIPAPVGREPDERLRAAIEALYFAAHWSPDRECDAGQMWADLRDAAGIAPGQTATRLGDPRPSVPDRITLAVSRFIDEVHAVCLDQPLSKIAINDKTIWLHRFVDRFAHLMRVAGYEGDDLLQVSYQHAVASWGVENGTDNPEEAAAGEFDALRDSQ